MPSHQQNLRIKIAAVTVAAFFSIENSAKVKGVQPIGQAREMIENLSKANYKGVKVYFDAIVKKNIYLTLIV